MPSSKQSHLRMTPSKARPAKQLDILSIARGNFGYTELLRGQESIRALLAKQDTLAVRILPTGEMQLREIAGEHLLHYFGDDFHGPCQNCDNCGAANPGIAIDTRVGTRREVA